MWMGPLFATIPCCPYTAEFGCEGRAVAFHCYPQREPLRGPESSDCEKLLLCATFTRSSNRSGWVPGKKTHQTLATRRAYTRIILGRTAHHLPDRRFIRSVRSAHVLGVPAYASTVTSLPIACSVHLYA